MKLQRLIIEGYRSFAQRTEIYFDRSVTIFVGANDHGKSNLLAALTHLNRDTPFDADSDLNWDREAETNTLPQIEYELTLSQTEQTALLQLERAHRDSLTSAGRVLSQTKEALDAAGVAHADAVSALSDTNHRYLEPDTARELVPGERPRIHPDAPEQPN